MNGVLWLWVALAVGLLAAGLFDRRARRNGHRVRADVRRINHERYSHAGSVDPFMGAPPFLVSKVEDAARHAADAERQARDPDDRRR